MSPHEVAELYRSGMSISGIGRYFGVSQPTVRVFMANHDIARRGHGEQARVTNSARTGSMRSSLATAHARLSDREWLMSRWMTDRAGISEIARDAGASETVVRRWLRSHGMPNTAEKRRDAISRLSAAYADGLPLREAADLVGVSLATASRWTSGVVPKRASNSYDRPFCRVSAGQQELADMIAEWGLAVDLNNRTSVAGTEIDVLVPDRTFGIEYNGLYYHSERGGQKGRGYHLDKTQRAAAAGIELMHVFEDDWQARRNIVESMIRHRIGRTGTKIAARKCAVVEMGVDARKRFFNGNHIQGDSSAAVALALVCAGEVVAAMSFRRPRFTKRWEWELIRFACRVGTSVPGGFSRLLSHFVARCSPRNIVSYSDVSYSDGGVYQHNGFVKDGTNPPSYAYLWKGKRYPRTTFTKRSLLSKFGGDPASTEQHLAAAAGLDRIWNCGTVRWVLWSAPTDK